MCKKKKEKKRKEKKGKREKGKGKSKGENPNILKTWHVPLSDATRSAVVSLLNAMSQLRDTARPRTYTPTPCTPTRHPWVVWGDDGCDMM